MATIAQIQTEACSSGIGKLTSPIGLMQVIAQLSNTRSVSPDNPLSPEMQDWVDRIEAAGGVQPSDATLTAAQTFYDSVTPILSKFKAICLMVPDSLTAAITPVYKTAGHDSWINSGNVSPFTGANLSINGLAGSLVTRPYLRTGVMMGGIMTQTSAGVTVYVSNNPGQDAADMGVVDGFGTCALYFEYAGDSYFDCWNAATNEISGANVANGFLSASRIGNNNSMYFANGSIAFAQLATANQAPTSPPSTQDFYVFDTNSSGTPQNDPIDRTLSFVAIHAGLTSAESEDLFDAVQAFRVAIGGGFI